MSDSVEVIDCELVPLPSPLRLASPNFVASLKEVEAKIASLRVVDPDSAQQAANLQSRLTTAGKILEDTRVKLVAPVLDQQRRINALAKGPADRIENAKRTLKAALTNYDNEQQRIAREAEEKRQAELRKLELKRLDEERAARLKADELAKIAEEAAAKRAKENRPPPTPVMDFGEPEAPQKTAVENEIERLKFTPVVAAPKPVGIAYRTTLVPVITDSSQLPDLFLIKTPNMAAIKATFCTGWKEGEPIPECAGVRFEPNKVPVSTGR